MPPVTPTKEATEEPSVTIRPATVEDVGLILEMIRGLAEYEKLLHEVVADEDSLRRHLFGDTPRAEVVILCEGTGPGGEMGFALFFHNFSTFLGQPGIYLEDLFVKPEARGKGYGQALLAHLAKLAVQRGCGRLDWGVLDWNEPAIGFYRRLGARMLDDWRFCRLTGEALVDLAKLADRVS
ncbi:MAG: GNAT family N-acetyltransferase [Acidobacteriota bacterium]